MAMPSDVREAFGLPACCFLKSGFARPRAEPKQVESSKRKRRALPHISRR